LNVRGHGVGQVGMNGDKRQPSCRQIGSKPGLALKA